MKTKWVLSLPVILILLLTTLSFIKEDDPEKDPMTALDSLHYENGYYTAESKGRYTGENYWGHIGITIEGNMITGVSFVIRDSSLHENVDSMYGIRHYQGIPAYQQQCVNDGNGIKIYPQRLLQFQNIDDVDVITGATWSHNIFDSTTRIAFRSGAIPSGMHDGSADDTKMDLIVKPNPFDSSVILEYSLDSKRHVVMEIYNSGGRLVKQLVDATQAPGHYSVEWDHCPSSGVYYCRYQAGDQTICNKIIRLE